MSNVNEREAGFYLARLYEHSKLQVVYVYGGYGAGMIEITGNADVYTADKFHWVADEPLDLEKIKFITENYEVFVD